MMDTFSVLSFLRKGKSQSALTPIYIRITVNGKRAEISANRSIDPSRWDSRAGRVKGNREDAREINSHLDNIFVKINRIHNKLVDKEETISAEIIKNIYTGFGVNRKTLLQVFDYHNEQMKGLIGKDYSEGTFKRFETTLMHLKSFLKYQYKLDDILLDDLKYEFITSLEYYFKTVRNCNHNSTQKYIRNIRKVVNLAVVNDWLVKDPFAKYKVALKEVKREYLSKDELITLTTKEMPVKRLDQVRDIFVFCCYTGLAYVDVAKLSNDNLTKGLDGEYWIFIDRTKTGSPSNVPLLPQAQAIIEKYESDPSSANRDSLLPVYTNQRMNAYLKEIATICSIEKNITFHLARHTFATTVTLSNGVPIESVSSMLGHKNMKTTQIYAKVVQEKVSQDMKKLKDILGNSDLSKAVNQ